MKKLCLIIGFDYASKNGELSSSIVDMYNVYKCFSSKDFMCYSITDIKSHHNSILDIIHGKVDDNIFSFMGTLHVDRKELPLLKWYEVNTALELYDVMINIDYTMLDNLVVYFTGHCEMNSVMILSNGEKVSFMKIRNLIVDKTSEMVQILMILDCCNAGNLSLPYTFEENEFVLRDLSSPVSKTIIYISSSLSGESALSSTNRSYFTKYLMKLLNNNIISIPTIIENIQNSLDDRTRKREQTINIYASFKIAPILWSWLLPYSSNIINIDNNYILLT